MANASSTHSKQESNGPSGRRERSRENRDKGDIVEDVVALLYENPEWTLQKRCHLPVIGDLHRKREIDVLVSRRLAGKQMHVAFECKNYKGVVDVEKIDAFISKLVDVGIPPQQGFYVSVNGYSTGAIRRAEKEGIGALILSGLTRDRLQIAVHDAFQSVVYLLLQIKTISIISEVTPAEADSLLWLYDKKGDYAGSILDLIWVKWRDGDIPSVIGEHSIALDIPIHWNWRRESSHAPNSATATVEVVGLVVTEKGRAQRLVISDASSGDLVRVQINGSFKEDCGQPLNVVTVHSENELTETLNLHSVASISVGKMRLPRIRYAMLYWPPSQRTAELLQSRFHQRLAAGLERWWKHKEPITYDSIFSPDDQLTLKHVEGTNLGAIWEPILPSHPASADSSWPFENRTSTAAKSSLPIIGRRKIRRRSPQNLPTVRSNPPRAHPRSHRPGSRTS